MVYSYNKNKKEEFSIKNKVFIDLDKENNIPKLTTFQGQIDIKKNGKILVKNSVLEDIDTITEQELEYILTNFKQYISPVMTSMYIPSISTMEKICKLAPESKVRFKTEKPGSDKIVAISPKEFFEGEAIFQEILKGIHSDWNDKQKQKYLYNQTASMLSYDLNVVSHTTNAGIHEKYSRNIFTAITENWGICASFAAMYDYLCYRSNLESQVLSEDDHDYVMITDAEENDYLTDPTYDSVRVKFGLRTENYAVSKEIFEKDHDLTASGVEEYIFSTMDEKELEELDRSTGYLENFGGEYTNKILSGLANNLEGNTTIEQAKCFLDRIGNIETIGRPTDSDYVYIMKWILSKSNDKTLVRKLKVSSLAYEDTKDLPRKIILSVEDEDNRHTYYMFDYKEKTYNEISEIELMELDKDREFMQK